MGVARALITGRSPRRSRSLRRYLNRLRTRWKRAGRLAVEHKHDRLALDAELGELLTPSRRAAPWRCRASSRCCRRSPRTMRCWSGPGSGRKSCWLQGIRLRRSGECWRIQQHFYRVTVATRRGAFPEMMYKFAKLAETSVCAARLHVMGRSGKMRHSSRNGGAVMRHQRIFRNLSPPKEPFPICSGSWLQPDRSYYS